MEPIVIKNLTKDFGDGKGIFGENLVINKGEMVGFVGTNGSGKTTTIRCLLGYIKPTNGKCYINGLSSWEHSSEIASHVGYVPGEIGFPDLPTGTAFLKSQAEFFGLKDISFADNLTKRLQLDPSANLKRMSKGMKQKTALVAALMNNAEILILDEPTTGLDPLMRDAFIDIIKEEHKKGKTILMSSHMMSEVEDTCDRVAFIQDGHLVGEVKMSDIKNRPTKDYKIEFNNELDYEKFKKLGKYSIIRDQKEFHQVTINIKNEEVTELFQVLKNYDVKFLSEVKYTLEKYFLDVIKSKKGEEENV